MSTGPERAAELLAAASRRGDAIQVLPDDLRPMTEAAAMDIQAAYARLYGGAGWKVGPHPGGEGWCGAPLRAAGASSRPAAEATRLRVEVEVAVVLARELPTDPDAGMVQAAIGDVHLAFELFRSSYLDPDRLSFPDLLADSLSNSGFILGSGVPACDGGDLSTLQISLERDRQFVGRSDGGAGLLKIVEAIGWLASYSGALGSRLRAGDVILTGARIGPVPIDRAGHYAAASAVGQVAFTIE